MVEWKNPLREEAKSQWIPVHVKSKSGALISAMFGNSRTILAKATIVLGHPLSKSAKAYFLKNGHADFLRSNGYNTIIFDLNGFGESSHGNFLYFEDVLAIGKIAAKIAPDIPVGYHGVSFGGIFAIPAFTDPSHTFDFAVIESAPSTLEEYWIRFPTRYRLLKILSLLLPVQAQKLKAVERIKEIKNIKSLLFIYSYSDFWTPVEMGIRYKLNSPVPTELWTVDNAQHANIIASEHQWDYKEKILNFFNRNLELLDRK